MHHPLQDSLFVYLLLLDVERLIRILITKLLGYLVVESLYLWSCNSLTATSKSSASTALALCHFIKQLSIVEVQLTDRCCFTTLACPKAHCGSWVVDYYLCSILSTPSISYLIKANTQTVQLLVTCTYGNNINNEFVANNIKIISIFSNISVTLITTRYIRKYKPKQYHILCS